MPRKKTLKLSASTPKIPVKGGLQLKFQNEIGSKNSLTNKTCPNESQRGLAAYKKKSLTSHNVSQNSLFVTQPSFSEMFLLREIIEKEDEENQKSQLLTEVQNTPKGKNIYLEQNQDSCGRNRINSRKKTRVTRNSNQSSEIISISKENFNFDLFKNNRKEEMEKQCRLLEVKIKSAKRDLQEMERCLDLMREIKERFTSEIIKNQNNIDKPEIHNINIDLESKENIGDETTEGETILNVNLSDNERIHKSFGEVNVSDTEKPSLWKSNQAEDVAVRSGFSSSVSSTSECTWASSLYINGSPYKFKEDLDHISNDGLELNHNFNNSTYLGRSSGHNHFLKKLWNQMKLNIRPKKILNKMMNKYLKNIFKSKDSSSISHYVTASENKTVSLSRNK